MKLIQPKFKILMLSEADEFLASLDKKIRDKIIYNIKKSAITIDNELFKKLEGTDIWEFRTLYNGNCYRMLAFWDKETNSLVVATHGFIKKTDKTPKQEIKHAEQLKERYYKEKEI